MDVNGEVLLQFLTKAS